MPTFEHRDKRPCFGLDEPNATTADDPAPAGSPKTDPSESVDWALVRVHSSIEYTIYKERDFRRSEMLVDKTMLCKAFVDTEHQLLRLCAPGGSGKTFNVDLLDKFFAVITKYDMPPPRTRAFVRKSPLSEKLDPEAARAERMKLFRNTLLLEKYPAFFEKHFCRYPVIHIDFKAVDVDCFSSFNARLTWVISYTIGHWISGIDTSRLTDDQNAELQKLLVVHNEFKEKLALDEDDNDDDMWENNVDYAANLFTCLSDIVQVVFESKYIILVDNYDMLFTCFQGKPWEDEARNAYIGLLNRMFVGNTHLWKGLLVGVYEYSLDCRAWPGLRSVPTITLATNNYEGIGISDRVASLGNMPAFGALFGYTLAELLELCSVYAKGELFANFSLDGIFDALNRQVLCYGPEFDQKRCFPVAVNAFIREARNAKHRKTLRDHIVSHSLRKIRLNADSCKNAVLMAYVRRPAMIMMLSRLIHDFDTGRASCFIVYPHKPILPDSSSANSGALMFTFDLECGSADANNPPCMNCFVSWQIFNGFLTLGPENSLHIPNDHMRVMWEDVRHIAIFGEWNQIEQDIERQQLIDSLYGGDISILASDFEYALTQLPDPDNAYSDDTMLELACRYVLCKLSTRRLSVDDKDNVDADHTFLTQLHTGASSWTISLVPYGRYIQKLSLHFGFTRITAADANSSEEALERLAYSGLDKISSYSDSKLFAQNNMHLELGVAIGQGKVIICKRP